MHVLNVKFTYSELLDRSEELFGNEFAYDDRSCTREESDLKKDETMNMIVGENEEKELLNVHHSSIIQFE